MPSSEDLTKLSPPLTLAGHESPDNHLPQGADLAAIATEEISPWGEKARIFDVFAEGKLVRAAQN